MPVCSSTSACPPGWLMAVVLGTGTLAFASTFGGGFLGDDFVYIARFATLPWSEWPGLFVRDWSDGLWGFTLRELRPFAALAFMGDARAFGGNPLGYRLVNLALHLIATLIVIRLTWRYSRRHVGAALVAGLVFAVHPAHVEAVAWITGRVDLLATAAALAFWLAAEQFCEQGGARRIVAAIVALVIGMFSKELCMFAPPLLLLRWLLVAPRVARSEWLRRAAVLAVAVMVFGIYAACRRAAFSSDAIGSNLWGDPAAWERQANYLGWLAGAIPFTGHATWSSVPAIDALHACWIAIALSTLAGLLFAWRRRSAVRVEAAFFTGLWYIVSVLPLTAVGYFSARHLYFPTVGLAIGIGLLCTFVPWRAVGTAVVIWFTVGHFVALEPWRTNGEISRRAHTALAHEIAAAGDGVAALVAVPETRRHAWLWAWASPHALRPPFMHPSPVFIVERQATYFQPDHWFRDRDPVEVLRRAPIAVALFVDTDGSVLCRRVAAAECRGAAERLAAKHGAGVPPDAWSELVRSLAQP